MQCKLKGDLFLPATQDVLNKLEDIRRHERSLSSQRTGANTAAASVDPHTTT